MPYQRLAQPHSYFLLGLSSAAIKLMMLTGGFLFALLGCASLPDAARQKVVSPKKTVEFENARGRVAANKSTHIVEELIRTSGDIDMQKHLALEQTINPNSPLVLDNKLVLLQDGPATYEAMFTAIRQAKDHINLETYIFEDDVVGRQFADLLLQRQAAGVQVNLIYDSVGCLNTPKAFFARLTAGGVNVLEFNPINPLAGDGKKWLLNNRDHRKLLVVDGRAAFLGGINISGAYSSRPFTKSTRKKSATALKTAQTMGWRDTHLQIEGPVVAEFQKLFLETWKKQQGQPLAQKNYFPKISKQDNTMVRALGSTPDDPHSHIYLTLLSAINNAERRVYVTNAYFAPDPQLVKSLTAAARRGLDVKLILPGYTDSWAVFHAGRSHYSTLLRAGVNIYEWRGTVMHSKTASIDGVWSTIGSTNLDWRSFLHNNELNAVILDRDFARQMDAVFAKDLAESEAIDIERWKRRSVIFRAKEWMARLVEYWL